MLFSFHPKYFNDYGDLTETKPKLSRKNKKHIPLIPTNSTPPSHSTSKIAKSNPESSTLPTNKSQ